MPVYWIKDGGKIRKVPKEGTFGPPWYLPTDLKQYCKPCGGLLIGPSLDGTTIYTYNGTTQLEFYRGDCTGGAPAVGSSQCGDDCYVYANEKASWCDVGPVGSTGDCAFNFTLYYDICNHVCGLESSMRVKMLHEADTAKENCSTDSLTDPNPCGCINTNLNIWLTSSVTINCDNTPVAKFGPFGVDNSHPDCNCTISQFWIIILKAP